MKTLQTTTLIILLVTALSASAQDSLIVDELGFVGVGINLPEAPLHVQDNAMGWPMVFIVENIGSDFAGFRFRTISGDIDFNNAAGNLFRINIVDGDTYEFQIDPDGNGFFRGTSTAVDHINTSSRAVKTDFAPVDESAVLEQLAALPMSTWRYKTEGSGQHHLGPVAEDFREIFGLGDGAHISTVDASGIALAAIKGLHQQVKMRDTQIAELEAQLEAQQGRIAQLEQQQAKMAKMAERLEMLLGPVASR